MESRTTVVGSGDDARLVRTWTPDGSPRAWVLIVHGLGEHSGRHERTGRMLAEAGLAVRSFDLAGHGRSGGRRGHASSWSVFLDAVQAELAELDGTKVLFGQSLGGAIALSYALSDRPQPDLLVLSSPPVTGHGLAAWKEVASGWLRRLLPTLALPNDIRGDQLSRDPAVAEAYFADPLVLTKSTVGLGAAGFAAIRENAASLSRLDIPTLVIHGAADTVVPPQHSLALAALPKVERKLYPNLRHECLSEPEGPDVVADVVAWIDRHLGRVTGGRDRQDG